MRCRALVVAKAPEPGRVKTRLGADIGMRRAAEVAAASLLDTVAACVAAVGVENCHQSLAGDLDRAVRADEFRSALVGWSVHSQGDGDFETRLAHAHAQVPGPVVQVGVDTPHVTPGLLLGAAAGLADHDAILGPAEDGGWWVLALRNPTAAEVLAGVEMSTPSTCTDTRAALMAAGFFVGTTASLRDVDEVSDAEAVAQLAPHSRFAAIWSAA